MPQFCRPCFLLSLGSVALRVEPPEELGLSGPAVSHLLLAMGTASLHWTLLRRAPICQY